MVAEQIQADALKHHVTSSFPEQTHVESNSATVWVCYSVSAMD